MAVSSVVWKREIQEWHRLDAEFWRPEYREAYERVSKWSRAYCLGEIAKRMRKGIFYILADEYVQDGVPFLRVSNVKSILLDTNEIAYISDERNRQDKKTCFGKGDVVLNKTGDIGAAVIDLPACNISQDLIGLEIADKDKFNSYYLTTFLNTKYGQLQLRRWFQGQVQMHLALTDARKIVVPFPTQDDQGRVERMIASAAREANKSECLYFQAERMVLDEVGWDEAALSERKPWTVPLSRARQVQRLDAEHFRPRYDGLIAHLKRTGKAKRLEEIATHIKRGLQPDYVENGEVVVVASQHLGRWLLDVDATGRTDTRFWAEKKAARIERGDLLIYATGAPYVGRTNWWLEDRKAVASNHVTILRTTDSVALQGYLQVFLSSPVGMWQAAQHQRGSNQQELYPEDIGRFLIYLPSQEFQQKVANLVQQSYQARQKAKAVLGEAKRNVEALIEGAAPRGP